MIKQLLLLLFSLPYALSNCCPNDVASPTNCKIRSMSYLEYCIQETACDNSEDDCSIGSNFGDIKVCGCLVPCFGGCCNNLYQRDCKVDCGYYYNGYCSSCNNGYYMDSLPSSNCKQCPAGFYCEDGIEKKSCQAGKYSDSLASSCKDCDNGKISSVEASSCTTCDDGSYEKDNVCEDCLDGHYCSNGLDNGLCPTGKYSVYGFCYDCQTRHICVNGKQYICVAGTIPNTEKDNCISCSPGKISVFDDCIVCVNGKYSKDNICIDCDIGHTCENGIDNNACENGKYSSENTCKDCQPGTYCFNGIKYNCSSGYISSTASDTCTQCIQGKYEIDNVECKTCEIGKYQVENECNSCLERYECSEGILVGICNDTTYSINGTCYDCLPGHMCINGNIFQCPSNKISKNKRECVACNLGKVTNDSIYCYTCPNGKYAYENNCLECPNNQICSNGLLTNTCVNEMYYNVTTCISCESGFYCKDSQRRQCPNNTYSPKSSSICSPCNNIYCNGGLFLEECKKNQIICGIISECYSYQYEIKEPSRTTDRICKNYTKCECMKQKGNKTNDNLCCDVDSPSPSVSNSSDIPSPSVSNSSDIPSPSVSNSSDIPSPSVSNSSDIPSPSPNTIIPYHPNYNPDIIDNNNNNNKNILYICLLVIVFLFIIVILCFYSYYKKRKKTQKYVFQELEMTPVLTLGDEKISE